MVEPLNLKIEQHLVAQLKVLVVEIVALMTLW
jgi:hypothetical protein